MNISIRDHSYIDANHEFNHPIPETFAAIPFDACLATLVLPPQNPEFIIGISCGPRFINNTWQDDDDRGVCWWVFSKYKNLVPLSFPDHTTLPLLLIFEAHERLLMTTYDIITTDTCIATSTKDTIYSGLALLVPAMKRMQSMGPLVTVQDSDGNEIRGIMSTMHGNVAKTPHSVVINGTKGYYHSFDDSGNMIRQELGVSTSPFRYGQSILTNAGVTVAVDFTVFAFDNLQNMQMRMRYEGVGIGENSQDGCMDRKARVVDTVKMHQIKAGMNSRLFKSGCKSGTTCAAGKQISSFFMYHRSMQPPQMVDHDGEYILIYDRWNTFAMSGDSGGVCFLPTDNEGEVLAVGMIISTIAPFLYLVLPLAFIEDAYDTINLKIKWFGE